jgi:hypothetical protein
MANLFPIGYEDAVITQEDLNSDTPIGYRNGIAFDSETGDFVRDGKNKILDSDGIESWKSWCIICIQTERYAHLACPSDFGIDTSAAMRAKSMEEAESILTREITEAILADPYERTNYVEDLEFDWTAPDAVKVNAVIHGIDDVTIDITAYLSKGGT